MRALYAWKEAVIVVCFVIVEGLRADATSALLRVADVILNVPSTAIVLVLAVVAFFFGNKFAISRRGRGIRRGAL